MAIERKGMKPMLYLLQAMFAVVAAILVRAASTVIVIVVLVLGVSVGGVVVDMRGAPRLIYC